MYICIYIYTHTHTNTHMFIVFIYYFYIAAYRTMQQCAEVDSSQLFSIGFCFGGLAVLGKMSFISSETGLVSVVS